MLIEVSKIRDVVFMSADGAQVVVAVGGLLGYVLDDNDTTLTLWVEKAEVV